MSENKTAWKPKTAWTRNDYVDSCNRIGFALRKLAEVHNEYAKECRQKFGEGPEEVLLTGYEE